MRMQQEPITGIQPYRVIPCRLSDMIETEGLSIIKIESDTSKLCGLPLATEYEQESITQ